VDINNKQFLAMIHQELGIFSMASSEVQSAPPPPSTRELLVPQERGRKANIKGLRASKKRPRG